MVNIAASQRTVRAVRVDRRSLVALTLAVSALAGCSAGEGIRLDPQDARRFSPGAPVPTTAENARYWRPFVAPTGDHAIYQAVVTRGHPGSGVLRYKDAQLFFWDRTTRDLIAITDHADPGVLPAFTVDASSVFYAEQRDPQTKTDGVNPDPTVKRVVRWDRATRATTPLTPYEYGVVIDMAVSGDGRTLAYLADADAFVTPADGSAPARLVTPARFRRTEGFGYGGSDQYVSITHDGSLTAFTELRGRGEVLLYDTRTQQTTELATIIETPRISYASHPALCSDGSRMAVITSTDTPEDDEHQTSSTAVVVDPRNGDVVFRSKPGKARGAETERATRVSLSDDCARVAYEAPGEFDGRDLDGNETFKDDVLIVADVATGNIVATLKPTPGLHGFLQDGSLLFADGSSIHVP